MKNPWKQGFSIFFEEIYEVKYNKMTSNLTSIIVDAHPLGILKLEVCIFALGVHFVLELSKLNYIHHKAVSLKSLGVIEARISTGDHK